MISVRGSVKENKGVAEHCARVENEGVAENCTMRLFALP